MRNKKEGPLHVSALCSPSLSNFWYLSGLIERKYAVALDHPPME